MSSNNNIADEGTLVGTSSTKSSSEEKNNQQQQQQQELPLEGEADKTQKPIDEGETNNEETQPTQQETGGTSNNDNLFKVETTDTATEGGAFVNQGLLRWEQSRSQWLGHHNKSSDTDSTVRAVAVPIEVDEIIDVVFSTMPTAMTAPGSAPRPPKKFPKPVPLPQMVDILVDLWEAAAD